MTDNEIIKALKDEIRRANYIKSYYIDCVDIGVFQDALDLINRQQAEIERLKKNIDGLNIFTKNHIKVIRLQAIKEFEEELEYFILNEDVEIVKPKCKYYGSYINGANQFRHQIKNGINNLIKEKMK